MKLGALNSTIRAAEIVKVKMRFGDVALQKTSLLKALKEYYTEGRTQETNLRLTEDDYLENDV